MLVPFTSQKQNDFKARGQAIVEFAIVLPILLMILVGILEAGRMVFIYAAVNNASREAARYASAFGDNGAGIPKYKDCDGIRQAATNSSFLVSVTTTITYDHGPGTPLDYTDCSSSINVVSGMRANVTVTGTYRPMVNLVPISQRPVTSRSSRTIIGILQLAYP